jgi:hypothetical protein
MAAANKNDFQKKNPLSLFLLFAFCAYAAARIELLQTRAAFLHKLLAHQ